MSASLQYRTCQCAAVERRFVPKADVSRCSNIRLQKADLFDHLVGDREHARWNCHSERLGGGQIDGEIELGRLQTGRSLGLAPLRMRPAYMPTNR